MKCPECVRLDLTSCFNEHRTPPDPAPVERFFDEDGIRHAHDHTTYKVTLICSNKHAYMQEWQSRCPHKACTWNERAEVKAGEKKPGES
jgi:hypothetical protein